jgi:hypothetical protein
MSHLQIPTSKSSAICSGQSVARFLALRATVRALAGLSLFAGVSAFSTPALAHDAPAGWSYPFDCCANYDCQEISSKAISERPEGYVVQTTGEVVGYRDKRVRNSPDGEFHWCAHQSGLDAGKTICLFVPPRGF